MASDMFAKGSVLSFFPTFVWVHDPVPEENEPIRAALAKKIEAAMPRGAKIEGSHSLQSDTALHQLPEMQRLVERVEATAQQVLAFLDYKPSPLRITGCWANVSGPGSHHKEHSHPNNFLSAVYYVAAPKGGSTINFHDPRGVAHVIAPHGDAPTPKNASTVFVDVKPGSLVLFPAWLRHSVDPNHSQDLRISIAFNLMFEQFADEQSHPRFTGKFRIAK